MAKYWFARTRPVSSGGGRMVPISTEGWIVVVVFIAAMVIGALGLLLFGLNGQIISGIAMFVVLAVAGASMFIGMAVKRGDRVNSVADYQSGKVANE